MFQFRISPGKLLLAATLFIACFFACTKDKIQPFPDRVEDSEKYPISLAEAMQYFSKQQPTISQAQGDKFIEMEPLWHLASAGTTLSGREVITVPLPDSAISVQNQGRVGAKLVFGKTGQDAVTADVVLHIANATYFTSASSGMNFNTFSGTYAFYDLEQRFKYALLVDSGTVVAGTDSISFAEVPTSGTANSRNLDCFQPEVVLTFECRTALQGSNLSPCCWVAVYTTIFYWVCGPDSGGGGGEGGSTGPINGDIGSGPGNGSTISSHNTNYDYWAIYIQSLPTNIFNLGDVIALPPGFDVEQVQNLLELVKRLGLSTQQLTELLKRPTWVNVLRTGLNKNIAPELLKEVLDFAVKHNLSKEEMQALLLNGVLFQQVKELTKKLNITNVSVSWLVEKPATTSKIYEFLTIHDFDNSSTSIANTVIAHNLENITNDDLVLLYDHSDIFNYYTQFLSVEPNESEENKLAALRIVMLAPNNPITNLASRLQCFNVTSNSNFNHNVSIYVRQPAANSDANSDSKGKAGHTWLTLEQDMGGGNVVTISVGLYPQDFASPCKQTDYGAYNDDQGQSFDVSVTWPVSAYGFNLLVENLKNQPTAPVYNLSTYNCSTFAVEKLNMLGLGIPATNELSLAANPITNCRVEGLAPGRLGQDIRNNYTLPSGATANTTGGYGPQSTCQ